MSTDDAVILTLSFGTAIGAVIAVHVTFRRAAGARDAVMTPTIFAVGDGLIGIAIGMIWRSNGDGRVTLEDGFPLLLGGLFVGGIAGTGVREWYLKSGRGKAHAFVLVVTLLAASIGAPIGWIVGPFGTGFGYSEQASSSGMMWGAVIGAGMGFLLGLSEVLFRGRGAT